MGFYGKAFPACLGDLGRTLRHPAAWDVGALTVGQYLAAGLGLLTTIVAARLLGPSGYGRAALILAYPALLLSLGSFKAITVSTRYLAGFRRTGRREEFRAICKIAYGIDVAAFLGVFLTVLLTGGWVAEYVYASPDLYGLMVLYAASFPFLAFRGNSYAVLTAFEEFRMLSMLYVLGGGMTLVLVTGFLALGYGVRGMIAGMALSHVMIGLITLAVATALMIRRDIGAWWSGSLTSIRSLRKELVSFFGWNYLMTTLSGMLAQVPVMFLGRMRGAEEAGFFRLAMSVTNIAGYPQSAAGRVVYPWLSGRWAETKDRESIRVSVIRWTVRGGLPLGVAILLLVPALPFVVPLVFGEEYQPMVPGAQVLLLGGAAGALFFWLVPYHYATGRVAFWTKRFAVYTALALGFGLVSVQWWGFWGIAIVFGVGRITFSVWMARQAVRGNAAGLGVEETGGK